MAELVGGAAVGAVFGELLKAVLDIKDRALMFKPTLVYLQSHLIAIAPVIKEIEQHNNDLGRPKEELESLIRQMEEGKKLVLRCSKIHRLNYVAKVRYKEQLEALVDSLVRFFIIDMQAQTARDQKETLLKVRKILAAVNKFPLVTSEETTGESSDSTVLEDGRESLESYYSTTTTLLDEENMIKSQEDFSWDSAPLPIDVSELDSSMLLEAGLQLPKTTIQTQLNCDTCRNRALTIAALTQGVVVVYFEGENRDQLVVIGDVDVVRLAQEVKMLNRLCSRLKV